MGAGKLNPKWSSIWSDSRRAWGIQRFINLS